MPSKSCPARCEGRLASTMPKHGSPITAVSPTDATTDLELKALQRSERRYRRLFESAREGILMLDADTGRIEDVNPYLIEMLGFSHAEFLGKKLWEAGPFADFVRSKQMFLDLQTVGDVRNESLPLNTKAGVQVQVEVV